MRYALTQYLSMVRDEARWAAYERALAATVRPGATVLDLGAGPGALTGLALAAGAAHVYAVDTNPSVKLLHAVLAHNGLRDRVTVVHGDVREVPPPAGGVSVIVADLRGKLPLLGDNLAVLAQARARWLAPDGVLIPRRDRLYAAPVRYPPGRALLEGWAQRFGALDLSPLCEPAANEPQAALFEPAHLLSEGVALGAIEYAALRPEGPFGVSYAASCELTGEGPCDGLGVWFEAELCEGVTLSCAPGTAVRVYGQQYFPFATPLPCGPGGRLELTLRAHPTGSEYLWFWGARTRDAAGREHRAQHSTFAAQALARPRAPQE